MAENVALTKKKQKAFNKSVEKTKNKIKKGDIKIAAISPKRSKKSMGGVIYVSNVPHGFYEKEMKGYFNQFGDILKVRVARSKRTGNSKGFAYVQFKDVEVAKIAAETMNNYLMDKRLIKAKFLPCDDKIIDLFKKPNFSKEHYPTKVRRQRFKKSFNAAVPDEKEKNKTVKALKHIKNVTEKLKKAGIDYDFTPVQIPKYLLESNKEENNADDSSSEDIVFTSPEDMKKNLKELADKKSKKNNKRKGTVNVDIGSPKKAKKNNKSANTEIVKPMKEKKQKKNIINENKNGQTKQKKSKKENKLEINKNKKTPKENNTNKKIENMPAKNKTNQNKTKINKIAVNGANKNTSPKQKNKKNILERNDITTNINIKKSLTKNKEKKNKLDNTENSTNENNENINKEKREKKMDKKNKQTAIIANIVNNVTEKTQIKKKAKKNKDSQVENLNKQKVVKNKIVGVTKKSKKAQKPAKISNKKADLIKEQIKASAQVKTIKKIEKKNSPGKKNKMISI